MKPMNHITMKDPQQAFAATIINEKYTQLGYNEGLLGNMTEPVKACEDENGYYVTYRNGRIYWTYATGAFAVHGQILQKWANLGFEQSHLGYPIGDEKESVNGNVRYNRFQGGILYCTPDTGVEEIHVSISRCKISSWFKKPSYAA